MNTQRRIIIVGTMDATAGLPNGARCLMCTAAGCTRRNIAECSPWMPTGPPEPLIEDTSRRARREQKYGRHDSWKKKWED